MSKDPAFPFYPQDFITGTYTMTDKQVGQYIRLLCLQHQQGHLTEDKMLSVCKKRDPDIWSKFSIDENGLYYNHRLDEEIEKRRQHSIKQQSNVFKRWNKNGTDVGNTVVLPLENENEIEKESNVVSDKEGVQGEEKKPPKREKKLIPAPSLEAVTDYAKSRNSGVDPKRFWEYFDAGGWVDSKGEPVRNWKQKFITWEGKGNAPQKPGRFDALIKAGREASDRERNNQGSGFDGIVLDKLPSPDD